MATLRDFATAREIEYLDAIEKHGSERKAADALQVSRGTVSKAMVRLKAKASKRGFSPEHDMHHVVPEGYKVRGTSTLYDESGKPKLQWVKSSIDAERQEELARAALEIMAQEVCGLSPHVGAPTHVLSDLLAVYPFGDPHVGLHVWGKECGQDFDLEIGRKLTFGAVDRLVTSAPAADTAILLLLGDVFHMDDQTNQTPAHRHQLDVDSRYVKVIQVGIETYRHAILRALQKHKKVIVKAVPGNHDPHAIWALIFTLAAYFSNEPRVDVDTGPAKHWYFRFGKVLIGSTHGDTTKHSQLGGIMACDRAKDWGETLYRYWYTGHIHSQSVTELPGVVCESFRTLAAPDAHSARHAYRSGRDMLCIVHHKDFGEIERHRCDVAMINS
ncbi:hypothetical protein [Ralstonia sp. Ralssp135]|uniref:hypothetical protein n=1 Tax=Ralstonia sp. Ralssp135 TaxID=3243016 RepID=UPI0039B085B8